MPAKVGEGEYEEKRSRFIAKVWPVYSEEEAAARVAETKAVHRDARHNVYAYIIRETGVVRYSDDGEPQGTGGIAVLNVFSTAGIRDFCCVVTRYFGGVLLGTGGLSRAYAAAAKNALEDSGIAVTDAFDILELECGYGQFDRIKREIEARGGSAENTGYGEKVRFTAAVPQAETEALVKAVADLTSGEVVPVAVSKQLRASAP